LDGIVVPTTTHRALACSVQEGTTTQARSHDGTRSKYLSTSSMSFCSSTAKKRPRCHHYTNRLSDTFLHTPTHSGGGVKKQRDSEGSLSLSLALPPSVVPCRTPRCQGSSPAQTGLFGLEPAPWFRRSLAEGGKKKDDFGGDFHGALVGSSNSTLRRSVPGPTFSLCVVLEYGSRFRLPCCV
jgi:hypothetical protein